MDRASERGYETLVARLRSGPPAVMRWTMAGVNVNENWIHHEDVRRANGEPPRPADVAVDGVLWGVLRRAGRFGTRRAKGTGIELVVPGGPRTTLRRGDRTVTLTGPVGELALFLSGRREAARVELTGDPEAVEVIRTVALGV
jgi:uncharacterized protein (TIGR03085 family)